MYPFGFCTILFLSKCEIDVGKFDWKIHNLLCEHRRCKSVRILFTAGYIPFGPCSIKTDLFIQTNKQIGARDVFAL